MKHIKLSGFLYRVATILPLALLCAAIALAYVSYTQAERGISPQEMGTLRTDAAWKVHLKDNPFYPNNELGSDYAYIKELVDHIQFDLNFAFDGAPQDAAVQVDYRVDGVLRANQDAGSNTPLLVQKYPNLAGAVNSFSGSSFTDKQSFPLSLVPYAYVIDSFQNAYHLSVAARLDLNVAVRLTMEADGQTFTKEMPLSLTIPLNESVFQISGTPSGTLQLEQSLQSAAGMDKPMGQAPTFLVIASVMLILTLACFTFLRPLRPDPVAILLRQALQRCKGNMVLIGTDPREHGVPVIPVADMAGLMCVADEAGQPVLYLPKEEEHFFFVLSTGVLYSLEIKPAPKDELTAQNGGLDGQAENVTEP